ncbi:hypothetical protein HMPREF0758_2294 [Serratia odorifera DSM 4582]|uniref:Uncharacterized protein n=1 Tax=Serratia odorifera DSM 4582 TaxID=667129 RepID=D4E294_SEROD|nr:hypothetical protein HMPREF0758_2294 [Serratia odorifera DSM 4582]
MGFSDAGGQKAISVFACAPVATDNEQDLTPIYPQIYGITHIFTDHWFDLQP